MAIQTSNRRGKVITVVVLLIVIIIGMVIGAVSIAVGGPTATFPDEESMIRVLEMAAAFAQGGAL